ncbi:MAG: hypothetical protein KF906_09960 [Actinobacteria bacterium]|nr:hypothetical protein [Actinomycetota bacterium]
MTEPQPPLTDDDLSAFLDGEVDAQVVQRIQSDPAALARSRELDAARRAVADEPVDPLDASVVDALVARAIAAADEPAGTTEATDAEVTPIVAPVSPTRRRTGPPVWAVAAVVVALVAIGLGLVLTGQDSGTSNDATLAGPAATTASDADSTDGAASGGTSADGASASDSLSPEAAETEPLVDLGEFATKDDLRTSLRDGVPTTGDPVDAADAPTTAAVERCGTQLTVLLQGEGIGTEPDRKAYAVVDGDPKLVYEFDLTEPTDEATSLISVVDPIACDPLITFLR